jgi:hypothetical protein
MNFFDMNFIEKIIYCYEFVFYKEYVCFNCGLNFRMQQTAERDCKNFIPACSYSCMCGGLCSTDKRNEIREFKDKYGDEWKIEYIKYIKEPINRPTNYDKKMEMLKKNAEMIEKINLENN